MCALLSTFWPFFPPCFDVVCLCFRLVFIYEVCPTHLLTIFASPFGKEEKTDEITEDLYCFAVCSFLAVCVCSYAKTDEKRDTSKTSDCNHQQKGKKSKQPSLQQQQIVNSNNNNENYLKLTRQTCFQFFIRESESAHRTHCIQKLTNAC